jgi:hypothetical protein
MSRREDVVKTFVVDLANNVRAYASIDAARLPEGGARFANKSELVALAEDWSAERLLEIWNKLPSVRTVRRFRDRNTAVRRIWDAAQKLEPTKTARIVALLKQPSGATLEALMVLTGWQPHSVRGFLSARVSKRMGFRIKAFERDGQHVYRIVSKLAAGSASRKENA